MTEPLQRARAGSAAPLPRRLLGDDVLLCRAATDPQGRPAPCHQLAPRYRAGVTPTRAQSAEVLPAARCLRTSPVPACPWGLAGTAGDPSSASAGGRSGCHRNLVRCWHWGCRGQRWEPGGTGQGEQLQR